MIVWFYLHPSSQLAVDAHDVIYQILMIISEIHIIYYKMVMSMDLGSYINSYTE